MSIARPLHWPCLRFELHQFCQLRVFPTPTQDSQSHSRSISVAAFVKFIQSPFVQWITPVRIIVISIVISGSPTSHGGDEEALGSGKCGTTVRKQQSRISEGILHYQASI